MNKNQSRLRIRDPSVSVLKGIMYHNAPRFLPPEYIGNPILSTTLPKADPCARCWGRFSHILLCLGGSLLSLLDTHDGAVVVLVPRLERVAVDLQDDDETDGSEFQFQTYDSHISEHRQ